MAGRIERDAAAGRHAIDHHHDRRRDQDAERAGCGDDAGAEPLRKTLPHHRRQHDRADRDHGGRRRAGDRGEQRAGHHAGKPQAAIPVPDHRGGKIDHAARDAAMGQEIAGEDEERDRHDLEIVDAGKQFQRHRFGRHVGHGVDEGQHRHAERDRDRHAGQHQRDQEAEDEHAGHRVTSAAPMPGSSTSTPSTWAWSWCGSSPVRQ